MSIQPANHDDAIWCATTQLTLAFEDCVAAFAAPVPKKRDVRAWIVLTNPLLQLRSVLLDSRESEWVRMAPFRRLQKFFRGEATRIAARGRFDSGIYNLDCLRSGAWAEPRTLAEAVFTKTGLPKWPALEGCNDLPFAARDESGDALLSVIERGGDPNQIEWIRMANSKLWE